MYIHAYIHTYIYIYIHEYIYSWISFDAEVAAPSLGLTCKMPLSAVETWKKTFEMAAHGMVRWHHEEYCRTQ